MLKRAIRWGVNKFIIILNIIFGMVSGFSAFYMGVFLIRYLTLFSFIFFIGGFVLLYYIIIVLILLRSTSSFRGKNLFNKIWVFFFNKIIKGLFEGRNSNN